MNAAEAATAQQLAQRLLDDADAPPPAGVAQTLAVAWALKDLCYEAWNSDARRAAQAASALAALPAAGLPAAAAAELQGLAAWTAGLAHVTQGHMAEAVAAFDRAHDELQRAGRADPGAQTRVPKIMALSMLGHHEEAAACAVEAQRTLRALGNLAAAGRVSLNLGNLLGRRDGHAEAARHFREAAVLFARLGDHQHSVLADIGLASQLTVLGDFDEALRIYARARQRAERRGLALQMALVDESAALVQLARGEYTEALASFESARARYEALGMPQYLAIAEKQLADAYLDIHLLPEAEALFRATAARLAALDMPEEQAAALAQQGRALALMGRPQAAREALGEAARLFERAEHPVGLAGVALAQAEVALAAGDAAAALSRADAAAAGFGAAGQADGRARAELLQAEAHRHLGRLATARAGYRRLLDAAGQLGQQQLRLRCLTGLGLIAGQDGHAAEATALFESAIEALEDQRRALPGDELRSAFLTDHLRPYQERLRQALDTGDAAEVLVQLERHRARALADALAGGAETEPAPDDDPALRHRLNWLVRHLRRQQEEGEVSARLRAELLETEAALLERARRQRLAAPALHAGAGPEGPFDPAALQAALQPGDALVAYGALDDELFALVVTPDAVRLKRHVAPWAQAQQALTSLRFQLETLRHGAAPLQGHLEAIESRTQARLRQLHERVWAPLLPLLGQPARLLIAPHGPLLGLPFGALHAGGPPLAAQHRLAMAPSARAALRGLLRPPVPASSALALGESSRLPHAAGEARAVAGLFPQGRALVGEQATLAALQAHAAEADVLHLACHAEFRSDNPRFSALHLHDGVLTVESVERLRLRPATVVISACESGLGTADAVDEHVGLVRAFLVAGASRVVGTLWPVDDAVAAEFMTAFHRALQATPEPAAALQGAQAVLRQTHPQAFHWAAFTLYGGW